MTRHVLPLEDRSARHAALGDPVRLAIVDHLVLGDLAPMELRERIDIGSNLLSHHLEVLEAVGLVERLRSSGDRRRRYVHLRDEALSILGPCCRVELVPALFVCSANSARSQLAAALWTDMTGREAHSAGTAPADAVAAGAVAAGARAGLDLTGAAPRSLDDVEGLPNFVVTVCDRAHEDLPDLEGALHWSLPDPVADGSRRAFDRTIAELRARIGRVVELAMAS